MSQTRLWFETWFSFYMILPYSGRWSNLMNTVQMGFNLDKIWQNSFEILKTLLKFDKHPPNISKNLPKIAPNFQSHPCFFCPTSTHVYTTKLPEGFGPRWKKRWNVAGGRFDDETGRCRSISGTFGFLRFSSRACHRRSRWRELSRLPEMLGSRNQKKKGW